MSSEEGNEKTAFKHHKQQQLCQNRPAYRQGKKLTAIKCYTVASESQHLLIYGVPQINLRPELKKLFARYGKVLKCEVVLNVETEQFTECYHIQFEHIDMARFAKRKLDNKNFYGGLLHVCYAPERETIDETRYKLVQRQNKIANYKF